MMDSQETRRKFDGRLAPIDILREALTVDEARRRMEQLYPENAEEVFAEACREYAPEAAREAERAREQRDAVVALYQRAGADPSERLIDVVRKLADAGDPEAKAAITKHDDPDAVIDRVMTEAVIDAAVERDPFWSKNEDGSYTIKAGTLITDPMDLYYAFRQSHPEEARAIAIEAVKKHVDENPTFREAVAERFLVEKVDEVWVDETEVALGLDEYDESEVTLHRFVVEVQSRSIRLPHVIVNPGPDGDEFGDTRHWSPKYATIAHHRRHAEMMIRVGNVEGGREQLAANAELLRRAGGNQSAVIGNLLS